MSKMSINLETSTIQDAQRIWNNVGGSWSKEQDDQLKDQYVNKKLDLITLCNIHKRFPGGITSRLRKLGIVEFSNLVRGFDDYTNSSLYEEIKNSRSSIRSQKKTEKENKYKLNILAQVNNSENNILKNEMCEIKKNIKELKNCVSELTEMIKATYEFEEIESGDILIQKNPENIVNNNDNNIDSLYQTIVKEHTNKENELNAKIKYYNENKEQLIRIKILEAEFNNLQNDINSISSKKIDEIEKKKREDEYLKIISENCKDAFQMYLLNLRNNIRNPHNIQINTLCHKYYINYTFNKINDNSYKVSSRIPNYGFNSGLYKNDIDGIYDIEKGFNFC